MKVFVVTALMFACTICFVQAGSESIDTTKKRNAAPDFAQIQFAGNIGFISAGVGYSFFDERIRAAVIYGYVPKQFTGSKSAHHFTLKSTLFLVRFKPTDNLTVAPYLGVTATLEPGRHSILVLPDRYPENYYGTTAFHFNGLVGLSVAVPVNSKVLTSVELYGECVVMDTMLAYRWQNENVGLNRILSASLGVIGTF